MAEYNGGGIPRLRNNNSGVSHTTHPARSGYPGACVDNRQHGACRHNERSLLAGPGRQFLDQYEIKTDKTWILIERRGTLILSLVIRCRIKQTAPSGNYQVI